MAANNSVKLIGNLTREPETRVTPKGTSIVAFGVAVSRKWKDQDGQQHEETTFVDCEYWGKAAEVFAKYHGKGKQCAIEGRLKLDQWDDKTSGQKRSKLKVVVEDFAWLNSGKKSEGVSDGGDEDAPAPQIGRQSQRKQEDRTPSFEDDVPF